MFEHCPHGTLAALTAEFPAQRMPLEMATYYTAQIGVFLSGLHAAGILHRDLKPENILIGSSKHLKVIDFGDSKYIDDEKNIPFQTDEPSDEAEEETWAEVGGYAEADAGRMSDDEDEEEEKNAGDQEADRKRFSQNQPGAQEELKQEEGE